MNLSISYIDISTSSILHSMLCIICSGESLFAVRSLNKKGRSKVVVCLSSCIDTQKYLDIFIFSDIYTNTMSDRLSF